MEAFWTTLTHPLAHFQLAHWEQLINDWFFVLALAFLGFELIRYHLKKRGSWVLWGDTLTNFVTLAAFYVVTYGVFAGFYIATFYYVHQFAWFAIEVNWATVLICIVLADLAYYWEHRVLHRVNLLWATHSVHHSSPFYNISVAYRHGPLDGFWPLFFHIPLVLMGFDPWVVFFSEMIVQLYQTALHTETVGKFPKWIEAVFNTPSHHRVHHGSNRQYLDKNYAGIFIIWDRFFGTFEEEQEAVVYGLTQPIDSVNPVVAWFHGFWRVGKSVYQANGFSNKMGHLFGPPGWRPKKALAASATVNHQG